MSKQLFKVEDLKNLNQVSKTKPECKADSACSFLITETAHNLKSFVLLQQHTWKKLWVWLVRKAKFPPSVKFFKLTIFLW